MVSLRLALATSVAPLAVAAQQPPDSVRRDTVSQTLRAVTVTETRAVAISGGTSAVVIRPAELRSSPAPTLEQALRESPFVHVRQNSRGEMELSVRGSDSRQTAVLFDGVPLTLGWDHRTDPSLIPITATHRLVIVRGLSSLLNGPNTLGGTIEVTHDDATLASGLQLWGGTGLDETGAWVASLGAAGKAGEFGGGGLYLRGGLARRDRDGVNVPEGVGDLSAADGLRTNSDLQQTEGFASVRWSGPMGRAAGLSLSAFDAERGVPPEEHIGGPRLWRYPYHQRAIAALSVNSGVFFTPLGSGTMTLGAGYNAGNLKIQSFTDRTYTTVAGEELGNERTFNSRLLASHSLGSRSTLRAAASLADIQYRETLSPAAGADYRQKLWSTGFEVETNLGERTSFAAGVVHDRSRTPETGGRTPGQEPFGSTGWRAGLSHDLGNSVRLHASASRRARLPALRELYSGALNRFRPNPDLEPETLLGFEGGVTADRMIGERSTATFQATAFHHRLDDAIVRITLSNPTRFMRLNRDRIESSGAELLAGFTFGPDRARAVTLTGDALFQNINVIDRTANDAQRRPENNPESRGSVELGVPLPAGLRGLANVGFTGTQYCLNAETSSEIRLSAQAQSDLTLERAFRLAGSGVMRSLRALVSLDNVTDATVYDQCGLPQPGRTLRLMFSFR
ncbi:MAG: TonB-dependent receptor plug domain-containing protein [Gemmatimonadota bacterium]